MLQLLYVYTHVPFPLCSQNDRQAEFLALREKVLGLWKELEMEPHEEFEQQVATGDIRVFVLSSENLTRLNKFYAEVRVHTRPLSPEAWALLHTQYCVMMPLNSFTWLVQM